MPPRTVRSLALRSLALRSLAILSLATRSLALRSVALRSLAILSLAIRSLAIRSLAIRRAAQHDEATRITAEPIRKAHGGATIIRGVDGIDRNSSRLVELICHVDTTPVGMAAPCLLTR